MLGKLIGYGAFGEVYKATFRGRLVPFTAFLENLLIQERRSEDDLQTAWQGAHEEGDRASAAAEKSVTRLTILIYDVNHEKIEHIRAPSPVRWPHRAISP